MKAENVYRIGLTGGIASGKSTVSDMLRELGAIVIDTDRIAREVTALGSPALLELSRRYGPEILNEDGSLRRDAVGRLEAVSVGRRVEPGHDEQAVGFQDLLEHSPVARLENMQGQECLGEKRHVGQRDRGHDCR